MQIELEYQGYKLVYSKDPNPNKCQLTVYAPDTSIVIYSDVVGVYGAIALLLETGHKMMNGFGYLINPHTGNPHGDVYYELAEQLQLKDKELDV